MENMNQGDLFNLISDLNFAKSVDIATSICNILPDQALDQHSIESNISRARNGGNGKPFSNLVGDSEETKNGFAKMFFQRIFKDCDIANGANRTIANKKYLEIKNYLSEKSLTFSGEEALDNESTNIEDFITTMIYESFQKHKAHTTDTVFSKQSQVYDRIPSLHNQTIYCPTEFYGREDILSEMLKKISSNRLVVLSGIGGIGKTYLSREFAHRRAKEYKYEQIVTYDKSTKSFKKVILSLLFDDLDESEMNENDKFEKRMSLLKDMHEDTLLIIDNVDSKPNDLGYFNDLCINSGIHIIVTTRLTDCFPHSQTIMVYPLPERDQVDFFKSVYPGDISDRELPIIKEILEYIDGHTLLIELVAKSMYTTALSPEDMLGYLKGAKNTELEPISISKDNQIPEKRTMPDIVKMLFDVGNLDGKAKEALLYLSLLPVEGVERSFFFNLMNTYRGEFNELTDSSWAITDKKIIRLHPVIRDLIRTEMQPDYDNCRTLVQNLHAYIHTQNDKKCLSATDKQDICRILKSINNISGFYTNCSDIMLISDFAKFSYEDYEFYLALDLYKTASVIAVQSPVQTRTSIFLKIGDVYKRLAMYDESISSYNDALESNSQQQPGAEKNLQEAFICLQLSDIYRKDGNYEEAISYNNKTLTIYNDADNNAKQSSIAEVYNKRGIIYLNKSDVKGISASEKAKDLEEALQYYQKGLSIRKEINETARQLAYSYHNIGTTYNKLKEYELARKNHEQALHLRESDKDISLTDIASSHVWIGNDLLALGDPYMEMAKEHFETSLEIRENILGKTHPEVAWTLISLSKWYEKKGDISTAIDYAERAYRIRIAKFARTHNYVKQNKALIEKLKEELND